MPDQGRLSYCLHCKDMTETIIYTNREFMLFKLQRRVCKKCGEVKIQSRIEQ